jgi:PKD repeat protein
MKLKVVIFIALFSKILIVQAQNEACKWYFEQYNGLDFSGDTVKYLSGCQFGENESSSSICDSNGNMLFYSNGLTIYNKYNTIVKNGTDLGFPAGTNITSSYQGTLLLKHPDNDSLLYLFSTDLQGRGGGLVYAIINIHGNNDSGVVLQKKIKLTGPINEPVNAVNHQNGRDIWLACHSYEKDYYYKFLLTKNGVISCPIISKIGANYDWSSAQVAIKFSCNGKYLTHHQRLWGNTETFHFNTENGEMKDTVYNNPLNMVFGFEFSPNSRFLYVRQSDSGLIQIDLDTKTKTTLTMFNQSKLPIQMQKGPNGRIYGAIYKSRDLFEISNPDLKGDSCGILIRTNFHQHAVITALPNFNQSYFYTPSIDYKYEQNCIANSIQFWGKDTFKASAYSWQLKKLGKPIEANYTSKNINHIFKDTGKYEVRFIASKIGRQDTVIKIITIYPKMIKNFLGNDTIYVQGTSINKLLKAPLGMHCQVWHDGSKLTTFTADTVGVYYCTVTNPSFCEVTDTLIITECNNSLTTPSIYRSRDTLYTYQTQADSFLWFRNNTPYQVSKTPYLKLTDTGTYRVEALKKLYCNKSSSVYAVNKLGITTSTLSDYNVQVYPNPSNEIVYIKTDKNFMLQVTDITGKIILEQDNVTSLKLPKGLYFFNFTIKGFNLVEKVVVY